MQGNAQSQAASASEAAILAGQHVLGTANGGFALAGSQLDPSGPAGSMGTSSANLFSAPTAPGEQVLHTPTPTRELPNPLSGAAGSLGYPASHLGAYQAGPSMAGSMPFQAQTPMPPTPNVLTHRSNPSLASIASSTGSMTSSTNPPLRSQAQSQASSPASAASSPSAAVLGITNGQAGLSLASSVGPGQPASGMQNTVFTFSQPMPLHISTSTTTPAISQPRTPSANSDGSARSGPRSASASAQQAFASQSAMQGIAIAGGASSVASSNPTTPMPTFQPPTYPVLSETNQTADQLQQPAQLHQAAPLETTKWESGAELALRAAEDLASSYNKIANILSKGLAVDMTERLDIRQEFVAAVASLDKAFFLSPAGPGYIGTDARTGSRKRGFTVSSADEIDDSNKHRRTVSEAFSEVSSAGGRLVSPRSVGSSIASRPRLFHHTHSSPLLPVELHYRPTSTGVSDLQPVNKAADLAASGSHLVGRLSAPHPLTQLSISSLAEEQMQMQTDQVHMQQSADESLAAGQAVLEAQQQQAALRQHTSPAIHAPTPHAPQKIPTPLQLDLAATLQQAVAQQEQQTGISFLQQPPALDPQAYAQQVLRNQDLLLAQAGSSLEPAFEPTDAPMPISQSSTPTPYQQQYNTPPMPMVSQFQQSQNAANAAQFVDLQHMEDTEMTEGSRPSLANMANQQLHAPVPVSAMGLNSLASNGIDQQPNGAIRTGHPGSLDFTTLRGPGHTTHSLATGAIKEEQLDGIMTSPYSSSVVSGMSSFPFSSTIGTNVASSVTSESRSRATSISKSTSAARSRAPSYSSVGQPGAHPYSFAVPDATELEQILGGLTTLPSPINEDDDDYFDSYYDPNAGATGARKTSASHPSLQGHSPNSIPSALPGKGTDALPTEIADQLQSVFADWLPRICSDVEATDKRGEKIHQPLMAKRMAKLDEEHAFRPFKFRIQPFTLAFQDACRDARMNETDSSVKYVKNYLWNQPLISRFNDEGKKSKSRGNHVWSIEARFISEGVYEFRPPPPKIVPVPPPAAPGLHWTWQPKVLDSYIQGPPLDAEFVCKNLPNWLEWRAGVLSGLPPDDALSLSLEIVAEYSDNNKLTQIFSIPVVADNGIRPLAGEAVLAPADHAAPNMLTFTTKAGPALHESTNSSSGSELTASTNSVQTPPAFMPPPAPAPTPAVMPNSIHPTTGMQHPTMAQSKMQSLQHPGAGSNGVQSNSPHQQGMPFANHAGQYMQNGTVPPPMPVVSQMPTPAASLCVPVNPTDATTLASAKQIKEKLVEVTTNHHGNLSALDPAHPPADPYKVSVAVDAAISHQLAVTAQHPQMPSATEVFNATLEVSTRSQQMQQEQLSQVVAAVTQNIQQNQQMLQSQMTQPQQMQQQPLVQQQQMAPPPLQHRVTPNGLQMSAQVTSQLADFSFTPCNTPGTRSPDTQYQARMHELHH